MGFLSLKLRPFSELEVVGLAECLHALVRSNLQRLECDFPGVVSRYGNTATAEESIAGARRMAVASKGRYGALAVVVEGNIYGVATYWQQALYPRRGLLGVGRGRRVVQGPQVAIWLGSSQMRSYVSLLPLILRTGARTLAANPRLHGQPWTLVRPAHRVVCEALTDSENGFGGFGVWAGRRWQHVDGVAEHRLLYVSHHTIDDLRTLYTHPTTS